MAVFAEYLEARCWVENDDVVGAVPTGDAPTISEWSTIVLPTKVRFFTVFAFCIPISLKFVPKASIDSKPTLAQ